MTDEEIDSLCEGDEDIIFMNQNTDVSSLQYQSGMFLHSFLVEQKMENWFAEHNLQVETVAAALLKQFVEAQAGFNSHY